MKFLTDEEFLQESLKHINDAKFLGEPVLQEGIQSTIIDRDGDGNVRNVGIAFEDDGRQYAINFLNEGDGRVTIARLDIEDEESVEEEDQLPAA